MVEYPGEPTEPSNGMVTKLSPRSVLATVERLLDLVKSREMTVFAVIDHSGEAEQVGMNLRETKLVIFGSPAVGTPVMVASPLAALDLPLKVLVWADGQTVKVSYNDPGYLAERHRLSGDLAARLAGIEMLTDALVSAS